MAQKIFSMSWLKWFVSLTIYNENNSFSLMYSQRQLNKVIFSAPSLGDHVIRGLRSQPAWSLPGCCCLLSLAQLFWIPFFATSNNQKLSSIQHSLGQSSELNSINISINGPRYFWDSEYCTLFFVHQSERWCSSGLLFPFCSAFIS